MDNSVDVHAWVPLIVRRMVNIIGKPLGINPFPRAFEYTLGAVNKAKSFDEIYAKNFWGSHESSSGVGSELVKTERYRSALLALIQQQKFQAVFDAPCGDLNWMPLVIEQSAIDYQGGDISTTLVAKLTQQHPSLSIRHFDICRDDFPRADVWHCRDCLFHLPFVDICAALERFVASEIPYVLLTTHRARWLHRNLDIAQVGFRMIDFERPPFNFPKPLALLPDYRRGIDFPRYVALWPREAITHALATKKHHE